MDKPNNSNKVGRNLALSPVNIAFLVQEAAERTIETGDQISVSSVADEIITKARTQKEAKRIKSKSE